MTSREPYNKSVGHSEGCIVWPQCHARRESTYARRLAEPIKMLSLKDVLLGYKPDKAPEINCFIIMAKQFIFASKQQNIPLDMRNFILKLVYEFTLDTERSKIKKNVNRKKKWKIVKWQRHAE